MLFGWKESILALTVAASLVAAQTTITTSGCKNNAGTDLSVADFNGTYFSVSYKASYKLLTLTMDTTTESYAVYCDQQPTSDVLGSLAGGQAAIGTFKAPLATVAALVEGVPTFFELLRHRPNVTAVSDISQIVSPCYQAMISNDLLHAYSSTTGTYDAVIIDSVSASTPNSIWSYLGRKDISPLDTADYMRFLSVFLNDEPTAITNYGSIQTSYTNTKTTLAQVPAANKKRIAWVYCNLDTKVWYLDNSVYTRTIISDAGAIPFGSADQGAVVTLSQSDLNTILLNAYAVVDATPFPQQLPSPYTARISYWRSLAGISDTNQPDVLKNHQLYALDAVINIVGAFDFPTRYQARPDLLLLDLVMVQYGNYTSGYANNFLSSSISWADGGGSPSSQLSANNCTLNADNTTNYNAFLARDGINIVGAQPEFVGFGGPRPSPVGSGIYGTGADDGTGHSGSGSGSKVGTIIGVVIGVAAVVAGGFAFAFYKWSRRAKEDRFIELEEEMNNDIPMH